MDHIRLATIGTSMISDNLLDAAREVDQITYVGTYSRSEATAVAFAERHGGTAPFASLEALCSSHEVDAVYIASPNALHHEQALACIRAGKHVLVEKPICANRREAEELFAGASKHGVVALEAMRPIHDPAWAGIAEFLNNDELGRLRRATFRFGKYSSRYDDVLAGRHTNIFDARMASGALMDIGIYCVEPMVSLFGAPSRIIAAPVAISDASSQACGGVIDGAGSVLCTYENANSARGNLTVELAYSKISQDLLPSQIEGERGTLTLDAMSVPQQVSVRHRGHAVRGGATAALTSVGDTTEQLEVAPCDNNMVYELCDFAALVSGQSLSTLWGTLESAEAEARFRQVTLDSLAVTDEIRRQAGIVFPADTSAAN